MPKRKAETQLAPGIFKICTTCPDKTPKPITEFGWRSAAKGIRYAQCRGCINKVAIKRSKERKERFKNVDQSIKKKCITCGESKPLSEFHVDGQGPYGKSSQCKGCKKEFEDARRERRREEFKNKDPSTFPEEKKCKRCDRSKPVSEFNIHVLQSDFLNGICKTCESAYGLMHRLKVKADFDSWRARNPCIDCGEPTIRHIQGDHIDPSTKRYNPSGAKSIKTLNIELAKCVGRCSHCHVRKTLSTIPTTKHPRRSKGRALITSLKAAAGKCPDCGLAFDPTCPAIFEFDHISGEEKKFSVGAMSNKPHEEIKKEAAKTIVRCKKCHDLKTDQRRLEEWHIFFDVCEKGPACYSELQEKYHVSSAKIEAIIRDKMYRCQVLETAYGSDWINTLNLGREVTVSESALSTEKNN